MGTCPLMMATQRKEVSAMFIKNILRAFNPETKVRWLINGVEEKDIKTVGDVMRNGLLTYTEVHEDFTVENDTIIIRW